MSKDMEDILKKHKEIWKNKKILRTIYSQWYKKIMSDLSQGKQKTIELGSGSGNFKEFKPDCISSDIEDCNWLDMCFDAHDMPFENHSVSNIVMIDVLHHLADPIKFFYECGRVLEKGGKVIMLEPFPSPASLIIYKIFHPEPFIMEVDYFEEKEIDEKNPWDSNQAIPWILFFKNIEEWKKRFGDKFKVLKKEKLSFILYPLSGGFENKSLIPAFSIPLFNFFEKILAPFRSLLAFRCYIVIERN